MANLNATPGCTVEGVGYVDLVYTGTASPTAGFIFRLLLDGVASHETAPGPYSVTINNVDNGTYTAEVVDGDTMAVIGDASGIVVSCTPPDPDPDPGPLPETPGTVTAPTAKYMAVGGTLSNPIEYTFAFQVNDASGTPKTGHHVEVNIYKEDETTPSATTRARIRNGAAKVDVSRFVRALLGITPPAGSGIVQADSSALVRYHIGFVEVWTGVTMGEVLAADKYAVNAALQSTVNDFATHVILSI